MLEGDKGEFETAEAFGHTLLEYVKGAEFGTPRYQALSEYFVFRDLRHELDTAQGHAESQDSEEADAYWTSQRQITEMRIALLEHQIDLHNFQIPGYLSAYAHIDSGFQDLQVMASQDAKEHFPNPQQQRFADASRLAERVAEEAYRLLMEKTVTTP